MLMTEGKQELQSFFMSSDNSWQDFEKKQNVNVRKVWAHTTLETGTGESNIFRNMIYQYQLNPIASLSFIEPPCLL